MASDTSTRSFITLPDDRVSQSGSIHAQRQELPTVFIQTPPRHHFCMLCKKTFQDPVSAKCGHTFCQTCLVNLPRGTHCPDKAHEKKGIMVQISLHRHQSLIPNLTVQASLDELEIHCQHGTRVKAGHGRSVSDHDAGASGADADPDEHEVDPEGCPAVIKLGERHEHEATCDYAPTTCRYGGGACGQIRLRDMPEHLKVCANIPCVHKGRGCEFVGTQEDLQEHTVDCEYGAVSIETLSGQMQSKDQEIESLKAVISDLTDRMASFESVFQQRLSALEQHVIHVSEEMGENSGDIIDLNKQISRMHGQLGIDPGSMLAEPGTQMFKCKGTFVGHQGPVWALAVYGDILFSGSSDESIKVWETRSHSGFKCKKTLNQHQGIVHCLVTFNHKLYSGSSDRTINVWDIGTCELLHTMFGHDEPVCSLAVANGMLFSGSSKIVKVWDAYNHEEIGQLSGLNHWVRALCATHTHVFAGSFQTISVWSSDRSEMHECFESNTEPPIAYTLETSGGSVYSVHISDKFILCGTYEHLVHIWELETFQPVCTLEGHEGTVYGLSTIVDDTGSWLFSASFDRTIRLWNLDEFSCDQVMERHENSANAVVCDRGMMFSGAADCTVKVWSQ